MYRKNEKLVILESELSLQRPAWTQHNLDAYKNRYHVHQGQQVVSFDYFVKSKGLIK